MLGGGLPTALALDRMTRTLPGGSADLTFPGGAVALDALLQGRAMLGFVLSTALGMALAFGLVVEPFFRAGLLCSQGRCGAGCGAQRGVWARGSRHFLRVFVVQLAAWALLVLLGAALLLSGARAAFALPGAWLGLSVLADLAAVSLVAGKRVRDGLALFGRVLRRRPLTAVASGMLFRLAALAPLLVQAAFLAAPDARSLLRPLVLVLMPILTIVIRAWWWALAGELAAQERSTMEMHSVGQASTQSPQP
jgi:hypothetical protein